MKTALLVVRTHIVRDPRVRRQIEWLVSDGWTVDTLGLGAKPDHRVRHHYELSNDGRDSRFRLVLLGLTHLLPFRMRFRALSQRRIPAEASARIRNREYSLILFNDIQLAPWLADTRTFPAKDPVAHVHLDIHEYFPPGLPKRTRARFLLNGYYKWGRNFIVHPLINSRSVASTMADQYMSEFEIARPHLVRNCPPYIEQDPSPVDADHIELIHHGVAAWRRGFREMVQAMKLTDERFSLTFMLAGNQRTIAELKDYCRDQTDRIRFVPAVPMTSLSKEVNKYDAEVMFFPRRDGEVGFALPNKLFEAIQGRLAVVIGPTPPMVELVEKSGNGVVTRDWTPGALADAINSLTPSRLMEMKAASNRIAPDHTAETERAQFLSSFRDMGHN